MDETLHEARRHFSNYVKIRNQFNKFLENKLLSPDRRNGMFSSTGTRSTGPRASRYKFNEYEHEVYKNYVKLIAGYTDCKPIRK